MMNRFRNIFGTDKPIIGMLHLLGSNEKNVLKIAKEEIDTMFRAGVSAVLVENYFGSTQDCINVLNMLQEEYADKVYGVNILGSFEDSYRLAQQYGAAFMQVDSICGHLTPEEEKAYFATVDACRATGDVLVLGGVRFKYQPERSGRTLAEDLAIGKAHCDAIVVTGAGTGIQTDMQKIKQFKALLPDFPLIVGAGMTAETCAEQLAVADGGIVGSYFKYNGNAHARMDKERVEAFMCAATDRGE